MSEFVEGSMSAGGEGGGGIYYVYRLIYIIIENRGAFLIHAGGHDVTCPCDYSNLYIY